MRFRLVLGAPPQPCFFPLPFPKALWPGRGRAGEHFYSADSDCTRVCWTVLPRCPVRPYRLYSVDGLFAPSSSTVTVCLSTMPIFSCPIDLTSYKPNEALAKSFVILLVPCLLFLLLPLKEKEGVSHLPHYVPSYFLEKPTLAVLRKGKLQSLKDRSPARVSVRHLAQ